MVTAWKMVRKLMGNTKASFSHLLFADLSKFAQLPGMDVEADDQIGEIEGPHDQCDESERPKAGDGEPGELGG